MYLLDVLHVGLVVLSLNKSLKGLLQVELERQRQRERERERERKKERKDEMSTRHARR